MYGKKRFVIRNYLTALGDPDVASEYILTFFDYSLYSLNSQRYVIHYCDIVSKNSEIVEDLE